MLKHRVIPVTLYKDYRAVKSIRFQDFRHFGSPVADVKQYSRQESDEYIFLDIHASLEKRPPDFDIIRDIVDESYMPLTIGGGLRAIEDMRRALLIGADKVSICTAALVDPGLVSRAAEIFGSQCIVGCIDVRTVDGSYRVFADAGRRATSWSPEDWAAELSRLGCGELLVNSIDRDGVMEGYDLALLQKIATVCSIPIIALGGAGRCEHLVDAIRTGKADAVAAASLFYYTDASPLGARKHLRGAGLPAR